MKLLGAGTKTNTSGYVGASTAITFISPGEGLSKGLHNPYSDDGRSEYFFSFFVDPVRTSPPLSSLSLESYYYHLSHCGVMHSHLMADDITR